MRMTNKKNMIIVHDQICSYASSKAAGSQLLCTALPPYVHPPAGPLTQISRPHSEHVVVHILRESLRQEATRGRCPSSRAASTAANAVGAASSGGVRIFGK
jgi:hypothetical protein